MFQFIRLAMLAWNIFKSAKSLFSRAGKIMPGKKSPETGGEIASGDIASDKFENGCDAPVCKNPAHQHEKDLSNAVKNCRKKRRF